MNDIANPFGSSAPRHEGAVVSVEQQKAIAEVQAALLIARAQPRDPRYAMDRILQDCTRPKLAEKAAYQYSRGGNDIEGPSIRLAETIAKHWGNMEVGVKEISRRDGVSECLAYAWDLESNYREVKSFTVRHWRDTKKGGYALTDERDIYEMIANYGARRKRACILAVIDGDVIEAAVRQCDATLKTAVEITPEFIAQMVERFAELGINKEMIEKRIQRRLDSMTPALAVQLRKIYNSLKDGMSVAADWFDLPTVEPDTATDAASRTEAVKSRMRGKTQQTQPAEQPATEQQGNQGVQASERGEEGHAPFSYAEIAAMLVESENLDQLDQAADLIASITDPKQRQELVDVFNEKREQLNNKPARRTRSR
ncbi:hypothetical protein Q8F57_018445 [Paraburkholderia terrae]|uniref:hypothetical protein n=1 Tax=Paraburkholderia terrae TaxID=311230 RepID=UPI00296ACAE7|nr:hypothetical protein [Paraburkholderia terrae]MDW3655175.1 hypothetical protein [Paraburkholderia terrae]